MYILYKKLSDKEFLWFNSTNENFYVPPALRTLLTFTNNRQKQKKFDAFRWMYIGLGRCECETTLEFPRIEHWLVTCVCVN